jgi:hypothetical protein
MTDPVYTFDTSARLGRPGIASESWRTPLPPRLAARVDTALMREHERLAGRHAAELEQAAGLDVRAAEQADKDREKAAAAASAGRRLPAAKARELAERAAESRRSGELLAGLLVESAHTLLDDAAGDVQAARDEALRDAYAELDSVAGHVAAIVDRLAAAAAARGEAAWLSGLAARGYSRPWAGGRVDGFGELEQIARQMRDRLERDLERRPAAEGEAVEGPEPVRGVRLPVAGGRIVDPRGLPAERRVIGRAAEGDAA